SREITTAAPYSIDLPNLQAATGATANFIAAFAANAQKNRNIRVLLNGNIIINNTLTGFAAQVFQNNNLSLNGIGSTPRIQLQIATSDAFDRVVCAYFQFNYNRLFLFNNQTSFQFQLPASNIAQSLVIGQFNSGNSSPILVDLANNFRITAFKGLGDSLKFILPPTAQTSNFVLANTDAAQINLVTQLIPRTFINYANTAQQANYLIVSNPAIIKENNALEQYRQYRSSISGGSYNAKVYDIEELTDQFAYGIRKHPLAVKNFVRFAHSRFAQKPPNILLVGKASTYNATRFLQNNAQESMLNIVPTWGWPASDILLVSADANPVPLASVGRLSVVNGLELIDYLEKLKEYNQEQAKTDATIAGKLWTKQVVHVAGANDAGLDAILTSYLRSYEQTIKSQNFGGTVASFSKSTTGATNAASNARMSQLFTDGISLITYFGHSAATTLDYNLNDPQVFDNKGKYPFFLVNGCSAGNFFDFDASRLSIVTSLAEKFVLIPSKGTIGFLASTHFGLTSYLDTYSSAFYQSINSVNYGETIGANMLAGITALQNTSANFNDYLSRLHAEQMVLHGDPAIKINSHAKPDFVVEEPQVLLSPSLISVADNEFEAKIRIHNIGKAVGDSLQISINRRYPDGTTAPIFFRKIKSVDYVDSISIKLPVNPLRDRGNNALIVSVDADNKYDEISESNNTVTRNFIIFDNELRPIYPYPYAKINKSPISFAASTANPLSADKAYLFEIDTTSLFNSPFKNTLTQTSKGGLVSFLPSVSWRDSTAYYWRVAQQSTTGEAVFNQSSFTYFSGGTEGYRQQHVLQHTASTMQDISLDSNSKRWNFLKNESLIQITHSIFPTSGNEPSHFQITLNGLRVTANACVGSSIIFNLFDPVSLKPYFNQAQPSTIGSGSYGGFMGTAMPCGQAAGAVYNFEMSIKDSSSRRKLKEFMDWIPNNVLVTARLIYDDGVTPLVDVWKQDEVTYGVGNSLYSQLKKVGLTNLDSYNQPKTWALVYQKNVPSFTPIAQFSNGLFDRIILNATVMTPDTVATVISPKFGPAKAWKQAKWQLNGLEANNADEYTVTVIGTNQQGQTINLAQSANANGTVDLSGINSTDFSQLQLKLVTKDAVNITPAQLVYWEIAYDPLPEGALAPGLLFNTKDTLEAGEQLPITIAFKNVSNQSYTDSITVKTQIINQQNVVTDLPLFKVKKLNAGDTVHIKTNIDTRQFSGQNTLYFDVNPNNLLAEQYRFNNFFYQPFVVKADNKNPLLDVTFDGTHILNNDIVSSKPVIRIELKDESKFLLLNDTALISVELRLPNNQIRRYSFRNSDTLKFIPATSGASNSAIAEFTPYLAQDGTYELLITGRDRAGNRVANQQYRVSFSVVNKPMISNVFNYPNPFTTSTAFVFTLTGSEVPQKLRIQILTVTGKIVKEITQNELGPIRIGTNITEYKWDGTDMYGAQLANGVYLYRIISGLNGNQLDKYQLKDAFGDNIDTDKFFNSGYGKMYLMR
ncbi:MAG: C25 family cysteine peptidase, partial [Chitinophagaceae bacterium]